MVVLEAYLLRTRHVVAGVYHPEREQVRAAWLCSHILRRRGTILKSLRRNVKENYARERTQEELSFCARLTAK